MIDIHSVVPFRMCRAVAPHMREPAKKEREEGVEVFRKIVNVSSISGTMGNAGQANYSSGKSAVIGLTKTLAKEWGQFKINVNAVAFGFIETRLTAAKNEENIVEIARREGPARHPRAAPRAGPRADPARPRRHAARGRRRRVPAVHAVGELRERPDPDDQRRPVRRHDVVGGARGRSLIALRSRADTRARPAPAGGRRRRRAGRACRRSSRRASRPRRA